MSLDVKVNMDSFKNSINAYAEAYPEVVKDSLEMVGQRIIVDAVTIAPKAPIFDGFLTGAFTSTVTGRDPVKSDNYPTGGETGSESKQTLDPNQIAEIDTSAMQPFELRVGNSMKYAAELHENPFTPGKWSQRRGQVGYKFLSSKLLTYGEKYKELLAGFIRKRLDKKVFL